MLNLSATSESGTILEFVTSDPNIAETFPNGLNKAVLALKKGGIISVTAREVSNQANLTGEPLFETRGIQIIDNVDTVSAIVGTEVVDPSYLNLSGSEKLELILMEILLTLPLLSNLIRHGLITKKN